MNQDRRDDKDDPDEEKQKADFSHDNNNNAAVVDKVLVRPYIPNNIILPAGWSDSVIPCCESGAV